MKMLQLGVCCACPKQSVPNAWLLYKVVRLQNPCNAPNSCETPEELCSVLRGGNHGAQSAWDLQVLSPMSKSAALLLPINSTWQLVFQDPLVQLFNFIFKQFEKSLSHVLELFINCKALKELVWGRKWETASAKQGCVEHWALPSAGITSGSVLRKSLAFPSGTHWRCLLPIFILHY